MRIRSLAGAAAAALLTLGLLGPGAGAAAGAAPTPGASQPGDNDPWPSPPGANDWSCKPSTAHPEPVVLVGGFLGNRYGNWLAVSPLLARNGYCVYTLTYGRVPGAQIPVNLVEGIVPMEQSAQELSGFIDRVLAATGAAKVDIVGHSEGSLMPDYYVKFLGGAAKVGKYVALTPLWSGTAFFGLDQINAIAIRLGLDPTVGKAVDAICGSCREFLTGSDFLAKLNGGGAAVPGVAYTTVMTRWDEFVQPYTSGRLSGADVTNTVVQDYCALDISEHIAVAYDPVVGRIILNALDPAHARTPTCLG